jgi:alkylhydroperoxidase/carboxymuconolactone decarboxylase family protein YurZ
MSTDPDNDATAELQARIEGLRAKRSFLLPHHGAMAVAAPDLQDAYFRMYAALTQTDRHLTPFEREAVWLAILIAAREAIGTHHVELFFAHGGTQAQAELLTRLCAFALGAEAFAFMDRSWRTSFPGLAGERAYLAAFDSLVEETVLPRGLSHLAMAALQATLGRPWGLSAHILAIYRHGPAEDKLAEALSLIMWPVGVNHFLDACAVWTELMTSGRVTPSERYRVWAETPRQGGHETGGGRG